MSLRVGVDVGGTFTDFLIYDEKSEKIWFYKRPTTPAQPQIGILSGLRESSIDFRNIKLLIVSTTIGTNAILTGNLPRTALITTKGFRDVLEIRRGTREDIWDHYKDPPPPPVKRRDRFEVDERVDYAGKILRPLNIKELEAVVETIKSRGINAIAVCFINSYINPAHEQLAKDVIERIYPNSLVSISSEVNPEMFEFERTSTTVINAALMPIVRDFIISLETELKDGGFQGGLLIFHSAGGAMTPETSIKFAARLAGVGLVAGAIGGLNIASACGYKNIIGLDSGGTTALVSMIFQGELRKKSELSIIFGYPIRFPNPDVIVIGAGGGSVAWIDEMNVLHVGPQSMGAEPGPACYGKGGLEPTLTDANVVVNRISKEMFLGGRMVIMPELARKAIEEKIAKKLGVDLMEAAEGIIKIAVTNMANAVRLISIGKGFDPREFVLLAFGGSGPLHASLIAQDLGIPKVLVPLWPGVLSALGAQSVDVRLDIMKTYIKILSDDISDELEREYEELEAKMMNMMVKEGFSPETTTLLREMDARYYGQWRSLTIRVPKPVHVDKSINHILERFHIEHEREYNYCDKRQKVEVYALRVIGVGLLKKPPLPKITRSGSAADALKTTRNVFINGEYVKFNIYDREKLGYGAKIEGPAIVEQMDTTVLLVPGDVAEVDEYGNLLIMKEE